MAKLDVSLGLPFPLQDLQHNLAALLSVALRHLLEQVGDRLAQVHAGKVELHSLYQEQRFLEGQAFLVEVLHHELGLFDVERVDVDAEQPLEPVDLDDLVLVEA